MKMKLKMFNEAGAHVNGRLTLKAGATIVRGDILKFKVVDNAIVPGVVVPCTAKTDKAIGIALDGSVDGEILSVACLGNYAGTVVAKAGGAVTAGSKITPEGKVAEAGDTIIGFALDTATAANELIEIAHCIPVTDGVAAAPAENGGGGENGGVQG